MTRTTCVCGCGRPTMPNSPFYVMCKMIRDGWSPRSGMYRQGMAAHDVIPFEAGTVADNDYAAEEMYQTQDDTDVRKAS